MPPRCCIFYTKHVEGFSNASSFVAKESMDTGYHGSMESISRVSSRGVMLRVMVKKAFGSECACYFPRPVFYFAFDLGALECQEYLSKPHSSVISYPSALYSNSLCFIFLKNVSKTSKKCWKLMNKFTIRYSAHSKCTKCHK